MTPGVKDGQGRKQRPSKSVTDGILCLMLMIGDGLKVDNFLSEEAKVKWKKLHEQKIVDQADSPKKSSVYIALPFLSQQGYLRSEGLQNVPLFNLHDIPFFKTSGEIRKYWLTELGKREALRMLPPRLLADIKEPLMVRDFSGVDLRKLDLSNADDLLSGCSFRNSDLTNANLSFSNLTNADFTNAVLRNAKLVESILKSVLLGEAKLEGSDLAMADLSGADLTKTKFGPLGGTNVSWSPHGSYIAIRDSKEVVIWSIEKNDNVKNINFDTKIKTIFWNKLNEEILGILTADGINVWNFKTGERKFYPGNLNSNIEIIYFISTTTILYQEAQGKRWKLNFASGTKDQVNSEEDAYMGAEETLELKLQSSIAPQYLSEKKVFNYSFSPDGKRLAIGCSDGTVFLMNSYDYFQRTYHYEDSILLSPANCRNMNIEWVKGVDKSELIELLRRDCSIPSERFLKRFGLLDCKLVKDGTRNIIICSKCHEAFFMNELDGDRCDSCGRKFF